MNIINSFSSNLLYFKDQIISLTPKQKTILAVALAAICLIIIFSRCCCTFTATNHTSNIHRSTKVKADFATQHFERQVHVSNHGSRNVTVNGQVLLDERW